MKFLPGVPKPPAHNSHLKTRLPAARSGCLGEKKGFAKCFCRCPGDGEHEEDPFHARSPHSRKEWFLFNCGVQDVCSTLLKRLKPKQSQTKMCQSRTTGTLPPRPSPLRNSSIFRGLVISQSSVHVCWLGLLGPSMVSK